MRLLPGLLLVTMLLDAAPAAVKRVEKRLSRPDGVKIVYDVRGTHLSSRGDTTLVFVHGWASERGAWREQADYFAESYRVVTLDLAGHGQSTTGRRKVWTLASLSDDVRAVMERLKLKRVILVGHSMGGPVSLLAATQEPGVRAVVLVDSLHNAEKNLTRGEADQFAGMFVKDFRGAMTQVIGGMFPQGSALQGEVTAKAVKGDAAILTALIRDYPNVNFPALLQAVQVPVRAINAAPRVASDPDTNLAVNRKYADFDATVLSEVGHFLMLERPGEFNAMLREWLTALK